MSNIPANVIRQNIVKNAPGTLRSDALGAGGGFVNPVTGASTGPMLARTYQNANYQQFNFTGSMYLPFDQNRIYLMIQNQGSTTMLIDFTGVSGSSTVGLQLPGSVFAYYEPLIAPVTAINITGNGFAISGSL